MRFQTVCPSCGQPVWTDTDAVDQQTNCQHCHKLFQVQPPPPPESARATSLHLVSDPVMQRARTDAYHTLSRMNVTPASSMVEVLGHPYPCDDEGIEAYDKLTNPQPRLELDLLMYPVWSSAERDSHGSV